MKQWDLSLTLISSINFSLERFWQSEPFHVHHKSWEDYSKSQRQPSVTGAIMEYPIPVLASCSHCSKCLQILI